MKCYLIKRYFCQAVCRLEKAFGSLPSVYQEALESILDDLDYHFDERDVENMIHRFEMELLDMQIMLDEIFPEEPDDQDRKALNRYLKAIEFADGRLAKIGALLSER